MKKIFIFSLIVFLLIIFVTMNLAGDKQKGVNINITPQPTITAGPLELTGWIPAWDSQKAEDALPPVMSKFKTFSPMLYRVMADGSLGRHDISNWDFILSTAQEKNVPVAPVITDEGDTTRIQKLLRDSSTQKKFIEDLVTEAKSENYSGWSIDIEKLTSKDRNVFSSFIKNVSIALHKNNLKLHVIAYGKGDDETYDPALAHDYVVFGRYADQVQLMIYYYNNEFTDPGGQTPRDWYSSVLDYALKTIPHEKIVIGLSTYGNDWGGKDDEVEGLSFQEVQQRITEENPDITYDEKELSMVAKYTKDNVDHTLMFENARTITEKMRIAREEFKLNKFALWSLGNEDPEVWKKL